MCPADHGKWLAEFFSQQDGVTVDFRDDDDGVGHWTYCRGDFVTDPEKSMLKYMLAMWRGEYTPSTVHNPIRKKGKGSTRQRNNNVEIQVAPSPSAV